MTSGDLFSIDATAEQPSPVAVDHVSFQRELKSAKLSRSFIVTFVRQQALECFLANVVDPLAALSADLIEKRQDFLKAAALPWAG